MRCKVIALDCGAISSEHSELVNRNPAGSTAVIALPVMRDELDSSVVLVSNTTPCGTCWPALQEAGIDDLFSVAFLSHALGVGKPDLWFYRLVAAAEVPPEQVLFAGGNLRCDVYGQLAHGMRVALVRPNGLRPGGTLLRNAVLIRRVRDISVLRSGVRPVTPGRPARRCRRGSRSHKVLASLAAYPAGLSSRQLAELHDSDTGGQMLTGYGAALRNLENAGHVIRAGTIPSGPRNTPAVVYQITDAGRKYLGTLEMPKPPKRERAEYPWVEDAARRNRAGESVHALGRAYKVSAMTVWRALERHGIPIVRHIDRPRRHLQPEWAAEAARRYRDGESRLALRGAYGVGDRKMIRVLKAEGVTLRGNRQARRLSISTRHQAQDPDNSPMISNNAGLPALIPEDR